jgi:hypothetical protein
MLEGTLEKQSMVSASQIPSDGADHVENLEKHGLGDCGVKLANIEGGRGGRGGLRRRGVVGRRCWDQLGESTILGDRNSLRLNNGRRRHDYMGFYGGLGGSLLLCRLFCTVKICQYEASEDRKRRTQVVIMQPLMYIKVFYMFF